MSLAVNGDDQLDFTLRPAYFAFDALNGLIREVCVLLALTE